MHNPKVCFTERARNERKLVSMELVSGRPNGLRLIFRCAQWIPRDLRTRIPTRVRGIYALHRQKKDKFDLVYIGMSSGKSGIRRRLASHAKHKAKDWSHFSFFEVWPNVSEDEISELEGLFREIFARTRTQITLLSKRSARNCERSKSPSAA
jgi:hypothetical protein